MARFVCPDKEIRIAGGREMHLRSLQGLALHVANSLFLGDYLTSEGQAAEADLEMIRDNGFVVLGAEDASDGDDARSHDPANRRRGAGTEVRRERLMPGPVLDEDALLAYDRGHLWHPYTSMTAPTPVRLVGRRRRAASSSRRRLAGRRRDGLVVGAIHGYRHPLLDAALRRAGRRLRHVMFGGLTHEPAVRLAERLVAITPAGSSTSSSPTPARFGRGGAQDGAPVPGGRRPPGAQRFLTVRGGYHGDTFG